MSSRENMLRIKAVRFALGDLADRVVFVGGATVSLYADRPTGEVRPTYDVDVLVELLDYGRYSALEEKLRERGFQNDIESGIICRYRVQGIIVDIMPTSENVLGFSNKWYPEAFAQAIEVLLEGTPIKLFSAVYFIASKIEAFKGRGEKDGRTSTDFEDIVYLLNNKTTIWKELDEAPATLYHYLKKEIQILLDVPYIEEWIGVHLDYHERGRVRFIMEGLSKFVRDVS